MAMKKYPLSRRFALAPLAAAALTLPALAQTPSQTVTVTTRALPPAAGVSGFGDAALTPLPLSVQSISASELLDVGARSLADLTRLDAGLTDAYNAEGYWTYLSARGFTLDNRFNYRRDGLPINAETALALDNKSRIEVLKGTSGMQAGTSVPGGLVNLVVKRPTRSVRSVRLDARAGGGVGAALDLAERFGNDSAFGLRLNVAAEHLDPLIRNAQGERRLFALAGDWRLSRDTLIEAEIESSHQRQPSVPGFSLLGRSVPDVRAINPRVNLNNQPWSTPVVLAGDTASLRVQHQLTTDWRVSAHAMTQRLRSDDRVAFPYGCDAQGVYDRYCSNGSFDLYDYRSDNERRRSDAIDLSISGNVRTGAVDHKLVAGLLKTRFDSRLQAQAYNWVGIGNIAGTAVTPADPTLSDPNTNRDERSIEWYLRDVMQLSAQWRLWAGLRHTQLERESVRTDGARATRHEQGATVPWLALDYTVAPGWNVYGSWGQGLESEVVANRSRYTNRGQALPALKSRQVEVGTRFAHGASSGALTAFDIERPRSADVGACGSAANSCTRVIDGSARHRGIEAQLGWQTGPWQVNAATMWLDAARAGSRTAALNGLRPTNVPDFTARLSSTYAISQGLALTGMLVHEGDRMVLPDNSVSIPAWTRLDVGARATTRVGTATLTWRAGIDNVTDRRAWKEAPYQFGHSYLFPMSPRTWRLSLQAEL